METLAIFDFDGTVTTTDTLIGLLRHGFGTGRLLCGIAACSPWIVAYKLGVYSNSKAKECLISHFFKGMPLSRFSELCQSYFSESYPSIINDEARQRIEWHKGQGHRVAIVSASADSWVMPYAQALGIDCVLGTQLESDAEGRLTGRFATPNCYGAEKVRRITQAFPDRGAFTLWAYGNSRGDREMLDFADKAFYKFKEIK